MSLLRSEFNINCGFTSRQVVKWFFSHPVQIKGVEIFFDNYRSMFKAWHPISFIFIKYLIILRKKYNMWSKNLKIIFRMILILHLFNKSWYWACFKRATDLSPLSLGFGNLTGIPLYNYCKRLWMRYLTNNITKQKLFNRAKLMGANFLWPFNLNPSRLTRYPML